MSYQHGGSVRKSPFSCCTGLMTLKEERESKEFFCTERIYKCNSCQQEKPFIQQYGVWTPARK